MSVAMSELRSYVTACDDTRYDSLPEGFVRIDVTHSNLSQRWHDVLVYLDCTVGDLKAKLFKKNGTLIDSMELFIRDGLHGESMYMGDDSKTFRYYGGKNACEVFIRDTDPFSISAHGALENVALVEKYIMPDSVYDQLPNSVRAHIRKERATDPNFKINFNKKVPVTTVSPSTPTNASETYQVGVRCEVNPGGRRGVVKYFGPMAGLPGHWIGVDLDEPLGQNDGHGPDGVKYFECKPGGVYGCFAKCYNVNVGNYPEIDPFASSSEDDP